MEVPERKLPRGWPYELLDIEGSEAEEVAGPVYEIPPGFTMDEYRDLQAERYHKALEVYKMELRWGTPEAEARDRAFQAAAVAETRWREQHAIIAARLRQQARERDERQKLREELRRQRLRREEAEHQERLRQEELARQRTQQQRETRRQRRERQELDDLLSWGHRAARFDNRHGESRPARYGGWVGHKPGEGNKPGARPPSDEEEEAVGPPWETADMAEALRAVAWERC